MLGFLNVNKPAGKTAHDVVARVRKLTSIKQVGHGGTLDPMATGVLPIALGKACRLLRFLPSDKVYTAEILLGRSTDTDDIEGKVTSEIPCQASRSDIESALAAFQGTIEQIPPLYSAVHHEGKRLYALARAGKAPEEIKPRTVTIHNLEILDVVPPVVRVRIACSAGTYIRAIARDLGAKLGCGGCLKSLVREQAGAFLLECSVSLDELGTAAASGGLSRLLVPVSQALPLSQVEVDPSLAHDLILGRRIADVIAQESDVDIADVGKPPVAVTCGGSLVAICRIVDGGSLQPEVVIDESSQAPAVP